MAVSPCNPLFTHSTETPLLYPVLPLAAALMLHRICGAYFTAPQGSGRRNLLGISRIVSVFRASRLALTGLFPLFSEQRLGISARFFLLLTGTIAFFFLTSSMLSRRLGMTSMRL